jgi:putative N6-adenine-specific DNA methylase
VAKELSALGEQPRVEDGGVAWPGDARSLMRANLWLRTASRVVVRTASFRATRFHELEFAAKRIDWDRFLGEDVVPEFRVTARKSKLYHSDAIAERLTKAAGNRNGTREQLFVVRAVRDEFEISADTSGDLLHLRGYRRAVAKAPLRETLAAALLLVADWSGQRALLDPFCGSGTIPIEGALIARGIAPGLEREFAFMHWPEFDPLEWTRLTEAARAAITPAATVPIHGSDRDAGAITAATANAERAGVGGDITWSVRSVSAVDRIAGSGLVATNPPYGKRVRGGPDVRNVYAQLGNAMREKLAGWNVAFYATDAALANQTRLSLTREVETSNGGIRIGAWVGKLPRE